MGIMFNLLERLPFHANTFRIPFAGRRRALHGKAPTYVSYIPPLSCEGRERETWKELPLHAGTFDAVNTRSGFT